MLTFVSIWSYISEVLDGGRVGHVQNAGDVGDTLLRSLMNFPVSFDCGASRNAIP